MSAGTNFFVCSCAILALAIVNLNLSPTFNVKIKNWNYGNCDMKSDDLEKEKSKENPNQQEIEKQEKDLTECRLKKSMYMIEQATFIINLGVGLIGVLFGLFGLEKEFKPKVGIMGVILGIIGFIITVCYSIFNGIIFTSYNYNNYSDGDKIYKVEDDTSFAVSDSDTTYKCLYFNKENDTDALIAKFSDLMKSQYNYNRELIKNFKLYGDFPEKYQCNYGYNNNFDPSACSKDGILHGRVWYVDSDGQSKRCEKLYYFTSFPKYTNYDVSVRFLTCLILSVLSALCECGLFISSFMLFKESSD